MLKNTRTHYGVIAQLLHWISAIIIIGLFASGLWMVELDYNHFWYDSAPHYHESIGFLLILLMLSRVIWRLSNSKPALPKQTSLFEHYASFYTHRLLYIGVFITLFSGYLLSAADHRGFNIFNWFTAPPLEIVKLRQSDIAGKTHFYSAWGLLILAGLHTSAALKHHFINKDNTLIKMLYFTSHSTSNRRKS